MVRSVLFLVGFVCLLGVFVPACGDSPAAEPEAGTEQPPVRPEGGAETASGPAVPGAAVHGAAVHGAAVHGDSDWIRHRPQISLLFVGGQRGKLKPCGCSEPQLGGLERLATLVELGRRRARDGFAALALGWSLSDRGEAQAETKASLYRAALGVMGFDVLLLGTTDLHVPALAQRFLGGRGPDLPTPPANVPIDESGPLSIAAGVDPFACFEVHGLKIRALAIVNPEEASRLGDVAPTVLPPAGALQLITPRPETLWVVSTDATPASVEELRNAMRRLGPSIIVDLTGAAGVDVIEDARLDHGPFVVTVATLGKEAGLLDLDAIPEAEGGGWRVSYHVVPLDPELEELPSTLRDHVRALFDTYRRTVRERGYLASFGTYPNEDDIGYVGSSRCARCHPGIYDEWLGTAHAGALRTLKTVGNHWDPECVRCHVVGFERFPDGRWGRVYGGFQDPKRTPHLGGVGCECCHGPGEAHVESPRDRSLWGAGGPNRRDPGRRGCAVCHDVENSFGFQDHYEDEYRPRADHRAVPSDRRTVVEEK